MNLNNAYTNNEAVTALYCRLSKDDDNEGESLSIENQKKLLTQYAEEKGYYNQRFYVDDGISGTTFNRPGVQSMFDDIKNGEIKTVIVKDMSRFGRDYIQVGLYRDVIFPQNGVRFIAISDGYDSINNDKGANDFAPFKDIMNEWYAKDTSRKIKAVFNSKSRNGENLTSNTPYGYIKNPENPKKWIIDEEAAEVVREIFRLFIDGMGIGKIATELTNRQILNPTAYKAIHKIVNRKYSEDEKTIWYAKSIERIITNQVYVGDTVNNRTGRLSYKVKKLVHQPEEKWHIIPNTHEAIIERDTWELVQKLIVGRRRRYTKHNYEVPLLTGHLFCADCGAKLYYVKTPNGSSYYCCSSYRKKKNSCTSHYVKTDYVEGLVLLKLNNVMKYVLEYEEDFMATVMERENAEHLKETKALKKKTDTAKHRLEQLDNIIAKLYEDKVMNDLTTEMFTKLSEKYVVEQRELNDILKSAQKELSDLEAKKTDTAKFVKMVKGYSNVSELTPRLLNEFIDKVLVHQTEKIDGERVQDIEVYFNGVGQVEFYE